jgi:uncharacterized iron-regulated membrane protein
MAMLAPLSRAQTIAGERRSFAVAARAVCVKLHRYAGLAMAAFLTVAGLTGSILAFSDELDAWLNPELYRAKTSGALLPPSDLAKAVEAIDPRVVAVWIPLKVAPGESALVWVSTLHDPKTGEHYDVGFNQVFVEPSTGEVLGTRNWGAFSLRRENLIPFIYVLHYSLHVPGSVGLWIMGLIAIVWIFDCFIGAYLTFPRGRPFFAKWRPSWLIKTGASGHRIVFDMHRAVGLWFWALLLAIAVSAVYLNLPDQVFRPVVGSIATLSPPPEDGRVAREGDVPPKISREMAIARAAGEASRRGWTEKPAFIGWDHDYGIFYVRYQAGQHRSAAGLGPSTFYVADEDGRLLGKEVAGEGTPGDIFLQLQFPLHSGEIAGLTGRIVICITGILVALLSITGVLVWARKRRARAAKPSAGEAAQ